MRVEVLLIRHAEKADGPGDPGLTARGQRQAERVASLVSRVPGAIVSSPLRRALETARPIARATGVPIEVDERLRERMNWTADISESEFLRLWQRMDCDPQWAPPNVADARTSATTGRDLLRAAAAHARQGQSVILVTHGGAIADALRSLLGGEAVAELIADLPLGVPNASITRLSADATGMWRLEEFASSNHS